MGGDGQVSRTRDRNVAIAIIAVVAVGFVTMIAVSLLDDSDDKAAASAAPIADTRPAAVVHPSEEEACEAFADARAKRQQHSRAVATKDLDLLAEEYLSGDNSSARLIDLDRCGGSFVVSVGVESLTTFVLAAGPNGTPVVAYFQPLIVAD